jgi:hypothetical protein
MDPSQRDPDTEEWIKSIFNADLFNEDPTFSFDLVDDLPSELPALEDISPNLLKEMSRPPWSTTFNPLS